MLKPCQGHDADEHLFVGNRDAAKIYKELLKLDKAVSNKKHPQTLLKLRARIKYLQEEIHNKLALFLCSRYQNIYIPKLTKNNDIVSKNTRMRTKTVRQMLVFGHCKFVEKLKTKAKEFTNVTVHEVTEEYTSQACLKCCRRTKTLNEQFVCAFCNLSIDRDLLGSTNILLKHW